MAVASASLERVKAFHVEVVSGQTANKAWLVSLSDARPTGALTVDVRLEIPEALFPAPNPVCDRVVIAPPAPKAVGCRLRRVVAGPLAECVAAVPPRALE